MPKQLKNSAPKPRVSVRISEELKKNPVMYSGPLGHFGLGAAIKRPPLAQKGGYPPLDRPDVPEATTTQYIQFVKKEGTKSNAAKHIKIKSDT